MDDQFKEQFYDLSSIKFKENEGINLTEIKVCHARILSLIEEDFKRDVRLSCILDVIRSTRKMLYWIGCQMHEQFKELEVVESSFDDLSDKLVSETGSVCKIVSFLELRFREHEEMRIKDKRELENSILSLTEENRDISGLLKIAIMEKEAMEKRSKGINGDNRRAAILQIAEKGLQKVGFGFVMGVLSGDSAQADPVASSNSSTKSDASDGEEEVASLVVTVEHIMKNLRTEINDLRRSLNESRLNCEQLQALANDQALKLKENEQYIKDLEERENLLSNSVEELTGEITVAGEEIARWREACELEVEAGKAAIKEREKEILQLKYELQRTKSALETSNNKLQLKERLATTAMAAQAAAETCLRLADSRSAGLRDRIEELTRELENDEGSDFRGERRHRARRRIRHVCWPWQGLRFSPAASSVANWRPIGNRRSLPEMEALLRIKI
ncbi:ATP-binding protein [Carex rostrata]